MGQAQLRLFSPADEAGCYHDTARQGFFSLLMATGEGSGKKQDSYRLSQMPVVLSMLDHSRDTWLSQAEFIKPNRRVVNLARIGLLFADLDTYREPWAQGRSPEQLAAAVMFRCYDEGVPPPSILVFSGRGVQAKWLLDGTLPRQALPRWNACQRYLIDRLAGLGADPAAKDASRVLRLVNTVNSKSGEVCRVIHVEHGPDGEPIRYNFEYLAEALLPVARWDIEADRKAGKRITGYEYAVLVTNLDHEILSLGQLYRDRADAENVFAKLEKPVGLGRLHTHDLHRCQLSARAVALIYNWWSLFVRLANPEARLEAITSRPWLMSSVGRRTEHAGQTTITLTGQHAYFDKARQVLVRVSSQLQAWMSEAAE